MHNNNKQQKTYDCDILQTSCYYYKGVATKSLKIVPKTF